MPRCLSVGFVKGSWGLFLPQKIQGNKPQNGQGHESHFLGFISFPCPEVCFLAKKGWEVKGNCVQSMVRDESKWESRVKGCLANGHVSKYSDRSKGLFPFG